MSGPYFFQGGAPTSLAQNITGSSAVKIAGDANKRTPVSHFRVSENNGGTPSLTVEILKANGDHVYLGSGGFAWKAKAMTAAQSLLFDDGYILNPGDYIQITSSDSSGHLSVSGLAALSP